LIDDDDQTSSPIENDLSYSNIGPSFIYNTMNNNIFILLEVSQKIVYTTFRGPYWYDERNH